MTSTLTRGGTMPKHHNLPNTIRELRTATHTLINPHTTTINNHTHHAPSPYHQLTQAIPGQQGAGGHTNRSMPPLWIDAITLKTEIDHTTEGWLPLPNETTTTRLTCLTRIRSWRQHDTPFLRAATHTLTAWTDRIHQLLTPQPIRALWAAHGGGFAACPHCDKTMAQKRDTAGEIVGTPALQLANDGSTHCLACHTTWGPEHAMWVCRMLGYQTPAGVLE